MVGDIVLVGDQHRRYGGLILVGLTCIRVDVGDIGLVEPPHRILDRRVHVAVTLQVRCLFTFAYFIKAKNVIATLERALHMQVHPHIDAFVFQAFDPPVQAVQCLGVQLLRVGGCLGVAENIGIDPG